MNVREQRNFTPSLRACSMADKPGEKTPKKLSNVGTTKLKEILVSKTEREIFEATKLVIEKTWSKSLGSEEDQTAKPNQRLALCLRFLINKCL